MLCILQLVVPYSIRDATDRGGQKARGRLIWHLKCKTQVIRQNRAQAVKDAPCEQTNGRTKMYSQSHNLADIRFGPDTNGSCCHASSGPFPSAIRWSWQPSSDCSPGHWDVFSELIFQVAPSHVAQHLRAESVANTTP